eukprot:CAMPEP_0113872272 /NCGR_PEP_ID=MMETSP0780_2-20120614/3112_1 /TAXON_ID=652834 /ORGANISM="Palpitomonas bilix" /LENGTH=375 /DNA_ID=CAMNT_0000857767 /DNA_START=28 /DNA_END=1155 /DNA_ORIENTATION=+ /assembly_acc=CAM_ASM_000599
MADSAKSDQGIEDVPTYGGYLQLSKILNAQLEYSSKGGEKAAHDEMMFIVVHQVYELWFKLIMHELESFVSLVGGDDAPESNIRNAVSRLERVIEILLIMNQQFRVMETMTPIGFMEFRDYINPASGFQSAQFRIFENRLGVMKEQRIRYQKQEYYEVYKGEERERVLDSEKKMSLFAAVEKWLERTPFVKFGDFSFWQHYRTAVNTLMKREEDLIEKEDIPDEVKEQKKAELARAKSTYEVCFDEAKYEEKREQGVHRLSFKSFQAALLINIYQETPLLNFPFKLLASLVKIDDLVAKWRHQHAMLVQKMIGAKVGTGGSSGYGYLKSTIERMRVFTDFFNLSSFILPRDIIPPLPADVSHALSFTYENVRGQK